MTVMRPLLLCFSLWLPLVLQAAPLQVFVSIPPQQTFVERIGGTEVKVESLIQTGVDPHTYEPTPRQVARLSQSDLFIGIGFPFERAWMERLRSANPRMRVLDLSEGMALRTIEAHEHAEEADRGHEEEADKGAPSQGHTPAEHEIDPHLWTSPRLVKAMGEHIAAALSALDPQHTTDYQTRLAAFQQDLDRLDAEIRAKLAGLKHRSFMVYHPGWGYFADDYGLTQIPIERAGKEPGPKQLADLIEQAQTEGIRLILVQPQFNRKSAEEVAQAIGGRVEVIDQLDPDYFASLRRMADALVAAEGD
ncbi:zinc ABC transporter solute-binding protein [Caldichromatium japonicum]|uniref:High-affinity zinc uptake system protein ZnuA n=1 Tax=Caldichromatium japonicum TaxID=2699430 RepID=A0A6G7VEA3_9GAMM|nr:zinc ABC transporter substrate-binding protein [Caldichromatium japonicum]QIK38240.1 zinc ABC transporter solute-binding protein [Caldichromatium japonicum]